jgi:transglutaminase-like putative cysteine protease
MILDVFHWTEYRYSDQVPLSQHLLHLQPRDFIHQRVVSTRYEITPRPPALQKRLDYFGNHVTEFFIGEPHTNLHIKCFSRIQTRPRVLPIASETAAWESVAEQLLLLTDSDPRAFLYPSPYAPLLPALREWTLKSFPAGRPFLEGAIDLAHRIHEEFAFDTTATTVGTPLAEFFTQKRGVCQDFAHLQISCLRALGLAARYVSGYVRTQPAPGQRRLFGADASHAWVSVFCPGHGWIDLDPTNDRMINEEYVTLGWGRDYGDVSLIRGVLSGGGSHSLFLSVNVEKVSDGERGYQSQSQSQGQSQKSPA